MTEKERCFNIEMAHDTVIFGLCLGQSIQQCLVLLQLPMMTATGDD